MVVACEWHVLSHYREGPSLRSATEFSRCLAHFGSGDLAVDPLGLATAGAPGFSGFSMAGSPTRKAMVMESMSRFLHDASIVERGIWGPDTSTSAGICQRATPRTPAGREDL